MMKNTDQVKKKEILCVIKIGGNVIDDERALQSFLKDFASIPHTKILVHGGGKIATIFGERLGIASEYKEGRRITNDATLDLVTMVYGGLINKKIAAILQSMHCNAIGLCGADANLLPAEKRSAIPVDFGWVGDLHPGKIDTSSWKILLENGFIPVIAPLTHDGNGQILNTNADTIASVISLILSKDYSVQLIYCFEKMGILSDINDETSVIPRLDAASIAQLKTDGKLFAGILPKLDNAVDAIKAGVSKVSIGHADDLILMTKGEGGTTIY